MGLYSENRSVLRWGAALSVLVLAGCDYTSMMDRYVGLRAPLQVSRERSGQVVGHGSVRFTRVRHFKRLVRVCDSQVCGHQYETQCSSRRVCSPFGLLDEVALTSETLLERGRGRDRDRGRDDDRRGGGGRDRDDDRRGGGRSDSPRGGGRDHDHRGGGRGHGHGHGHHRPDPWPRESCWTEQDCEQVLVPVYCEVNCRNEEVDATETLPFQSPVSVIFEGIPAADAGKISSAALGIETSDAFQVAVQNPAVRPKELRAIFDSFKTTDQMLVTVYAKGYLLKGEPQLEISDTFKPGDPIVIRVQMQKVGKGSMASAIATDKKLPLLRADLPKE